MTPVAGLPSALPALEVCPCARLWVWVGAMPGASAPSSVRVAVLVRGVGERTSSLAGPSAVSPAPPAGAPRATHRPALAPRPRPPCARHGPRIRTARPSSSGSATTNGCMVHPSSSSSSSSSVCACCTDSERVCSARMLGVGPNGKGGGVSVGGYPHPSYAYIHPLMSAIPDVFRHGPQNPGGGAESETPPGSSEL